MVIKIAKILERDIKALDQIDYEKLSERLNQAKPRWDNTQYTPDMCRKLARNVLCIATNENGYTPADIPQEVSEGLEHAITHSEPDTLQNMLGDIDGWQIQKCYPIPPSFWR